MILLKNNTSQASSTKITVTLKMKLISQSIMSPLYRNKIYLTQKDLEVTQIRIVREDLINKARE
jgi:hypothetical protein